MASDRNILMYQKSPALQHDQSGTLNLTNLYYKNLRNSFKRSQPQHLNPFFTPTAQDHFLTILEPVRVSKVVDEQSAVPRVPASLGSDLAGAGTPPRTYMDSVGCAKALSRELKLRW